MLIVISKYISIQIILTIFTHKYHHHHHLQILCQSVSETAKWHQIVRYCAFLKCDWRPILMVQDRSPWSVSWVHIVLRCSFSLYHSVSGFLIAASKALRQSSFMEALATLPNKYHWFRWWLMSPEKKSSLESHLLVQIAIHFKIQYLFQKNCFKVLTEKYAFTTTTKINLIFFIVSNLVFTYFSDSSVTDRGRPVRFPQFARLSNTEPIRSCNQPGRRWHIPVVPRRRPLPTRGPAPVWCLYWRSD